MSVKLSPNAGFSRIIIVLVVALIGVIVAGVTYYVQSNKTPVVIATPTPVDTSLPVHVSGEVIVEYQATNEAAVLKLIKANKGTVKQTLPATGEKMIIISVPAGSEPAVAAELRQHPEVIRASLNGVTRSN